MAREKGGPHLKKPKRWVRATGTGLCVVLVGSPLCAAESVSVVEPGSRVRVTAPAESSPRIGTCEGVREGQLLFRDDGEPRRIPLSAISRIDVSRGRKTSKTRVILGAVVGGAVGSVAMGCLANKDDYGVACAGQDDTKYLVGGILGGVAGGLLGALVGRSESWERVDLDRLASPRHAPPTP